MGSYGAYRKLTTSSPRCQGQRRLTASTLLYMLLILSGLFLLVYEGCTPKLLDSFYKAEAKHCSMNMLVGFFAWRSRYIDSLIDELQYDQRAIARQMGSGYGPGRSKEGPFPVRTGPGIVICAGGNQLLINTYTSIKPLFEVTKQENMTAQQLQVLRETLKSKLPIEIYHVGPEDIGHLTRQIFEEFEDVSFVDLKQIELPDMHRKPRVWRKYMWKVYSLYVTRFTHVLLLDADSLPLRDPAVFFESTQYRNHGNLFWPDYWGPGTSEAPKESVYTWLGLKAPWRINPDWSCGETGQLFFDKSKNADVLEWLWFLNSHAELLYKYMLGDKDTFEMAFMLAGRHNKFQRVPVNPGIPLSGQKSHVVNANWLWFLEVLFRFQHESRRYLRLGMLQYGPDLLPAFLHRTERTKFADWKQGYDLETMKPRFFVPSLGPEVSRQEKRLMWNAHSLPESMVALNGTGCMLSDDNSAILRTLGQMDLSLGGSFVDYEACWYHKGEVTRQPVYRAQLLGDNIMKSILASIAAYEQLETKLGTLIRIKKSP